MRCLTIVAAPVLSHGGGIRHVAAVARAAGNVGWTVDVRVARRPGCPPVTPLIQSAAPDARITECEAGDLMGMARTIGWCLTAAGSSGGVVYAALPQTVLAAHRFGLRRAGRPRLVIAAQGLMVHQVGGLARRRIMAAGLRRALSDPESLVASVSGFTVSANEEAVGARIAPDRVHVLGNVAYGSGDAPWIVPGAQRTPPPAREDVVGILARLSPEKGVDVAIRAIAQTPGATVLEIGGDGPERPTLEGLARELGVGDRVRFLGWVSDPVPFLARWRALAIPSRTEGLPLAVIEAAWAGCPVIASAVGGLPEAAATAGGITLVPADDPSALANALAGDASHTATPPDTAAFGWQLFEERVGALLSSAVA